MFEFLGWLKFDPWCHWLKFSAMCVGYTVTGLKAKLAVIMLKFWMSFWVSTGATGVSGQVILSICVGLHLCVYYLRFLFRQGILAKPSESATRTLSNVQDSWDFCSTASRFEYHWRLSSATLYRLQPVRGFLSFTHCEVVSWGQFTVLNILRSSVRFEVWLGIFLRVRGTGTSLGVLAYFCFPARSR